MRDLESGERDGTISFVASPELIRLAEMVARAEGLSRAAVCRRATKLDLEARTPSGPCGGRGMAGTPKSHVIGEPRKK
jgi:hypothetical protein